MPRICFFCREMQRTKRRDRYRETDKQRAGTRRWAQARVMRETRREAYRDRMRLRSLPEEI